MKKLCLLVSTVSLVMPLSQPVWAAVISNPTLVSGPSANLIDPSGSETIDADASNVTAQSTLEARSDIKSYQGWSGGASGFATSTTGAANYLNYLSFTDATLPDIRFTFAGASFRNGSTGLAESNATRATSSSANLRMIAANNSTTPLVLTIDFGDLTAGNWTSNVNSVAAVGFTLSNLVAGLSATANYYTDAGVLLVTQTISGADSDTTTTGGIDVYFGYQSTTHNIGYVTVSKAQVASGTNKSQVDVGLDDLAFTTTPEPGTLALAAAGIILLLPGRKRRN